jgi:hypothetical protein
MQKQWGSGAKVAGGTRFLAKFVKIVTRQTRTIIPEISFDPLEQKIESPFSGCAPFVKANILDIQGMIGYFNARRVRIVMTSFRSAK